jgi:hypothetical protein
MPALETIGMVDEERDALAHLLLVLDYRYSDNRGFRCSSHYVIPLRL